MTFGTDFLRNSNILAGGKTCRSTSFLKFRKNMYEWNIYLKKNILGFTRSLNGNLGRERERKRERDAALSWVWAISKFNMVFEWLEVR